MIIPKQQDYRDDQEYQCLFSSPAFVIQIDGDLRSLSLGRAFLLSLFFTKKNKQKKHYLLIQVISIQKGMEIMFHHCLTVITSGLLIRDNVLTNIRFYFFQSCAGPAQNTNALMRQFVTT